MTTWLVTAPSSSTSPRSPVARIVQQFGCSHRTGNDDGILGQRRREHFRATAHQLPEQPVGEVVEVAHPLAQIGIRHVQHARPHVALHLLDRRFGGQAVAHGLFQPAHPAAIIGEHAIGFENGAMLALEGDVAARQHVVDRQAQRTKRLLEPVHLLVAVLVEQIGDDDARLVQHDMAEPDAVVERQALEADGAAQVELEPRPRQPRQIAGRDHLGDHHRRRFQRLDLVLAIMPLGAVLHDQDAERAAGAQHGNAEEGIVDLFAGLRQVGEGRMRLSVGKIERPGAGRDRADEALSELQLGKVDRTRIETFGGIELEDGIGTQHIERADLGHHVLGDFAHDAVEPLLRLQRFGHELAEPSQQNARAGREVTHRHLSSTVDRRRAAGAAGRCANESLTTAYPDRRRNAKCEPQVPYRVRRSGSIS